MKTAYELQELVNDLRSLRRLLSETEREIELIQEALKAHMEEAQTDELTGSDYSITWKEITSRRFDKGAMIRTFGQDCYDSFCRTTKSRRFVLSA